MEPLPASSILLAEGAGEQERRDEVDFEDAAVVGEGGFFGGRDEADAGVVDQDVGAAVAVEDLAREVGDGGFVGDVAGIGEDLAGRFDGLDGGCDGSWRSMMAMR